MQVLEACFEQPLFEQVMSNYADRLVIAHLLTSQAIYGHLVQAFAELANRIRNHRSSLKHLPRDRIHDVEQLDEHLFVECLLSVSFTGSSGICHRGISSIILLVGRRILCFSFILFFI